MKVPQDDDISQTERELTSPPSPKRSRPECRVMNDHSGLSKFDFPELLTFRKTNHFPSSASTLQKTEGLISTFECLEDEKSQERPQDTKSDVSPNTEVTSYNKSTHVESSKVCFIPTESYLLLGKEEQLPVTETDKLSFYQSDDTDGSLGESATIASTNTSSHSDGRLPGTSIKDQTPGGCSPSTGNEKYGRQVQKNVNEMQTRNEEVRCQPNCTNKESVCDVGYCSTRSQFAEVIETTQKRTEPEFNEYIVFTKEESERKRSSSDYADSKPLCSDPVEEPSGNLVEAGKKEKNDSGLQFCEKENVSVCDGKTEGQVNKKALILFAAVCGEGSILSHDVMLERNPANESPNLDVDDLCGEKRADGACKIIAKAQSETADHTTVTTLPARISQEPAEGDNDEGPFHVIDPAICSETDREAEENCCNSASAAGPKLSPSVEVDKMEMPLPLHSHMRTSEKVSCPDRTECFNNESRTWHQEGANDDFCQAGLQSSSVTTNETHKTFTECDCQWKSRFSRSPTKPLPPGDHAIQGSHGSMGHEFKEQSRSSCFSVRLDPLETSEVEHSQREIDSVDMTAVIKESKEICFVKELEMNDYMNPKRTVELEEKPLLQNGQHKDNTTELLTCDCKAECSEGEAHEWDSELKLTETEQRSKLERLSDQPFSADISMTEVGEEERKEVTEVGDEMKTDGPENSATLVQSEDYVQQQNDHKADVTQLSSGDGADEWTEWSTLPLGSEDGQEHKLSCVSDCQDKAENKADFSAFSLPSTSDAVVPCQGNLSHSQKAHSNPTSINCIDRFSPLPSALCNLVPEGFDTFEKIQLSLDDDDATGVGNIPVLVSSPGQLLYHFMSVAESNMRERIPEEEECITENMANRLLSSDSACNELPNFILGADAIALEWPEREPNCESVRDSSERIQDELNPELMSPTVSAESDSPASGVNSCAEFEMKNQFDSVLKELNLFFEISRNDFESDCKANFISPEQCTDRTKVLEGSASERTECLTSPDVGRHRGAASGSYT